MGGALHTVGLVGIGNMTNSAGTAGQNGAIASRNSTKQRTQLAFEEAGILGAGGTALTQDAILASREIAISGGVLKNQAVVRELTTNGSAIGDWGKFTAQPIQLPNGQRSQIHFHMNRVTGETNFSVDFKAKGVIQ